MKHAIATGAAALALGLSLAACGTLGQATAPPAPGQVQSPLSVSPATTADVTVSCKPIVDPQSSAPVGDALTPQVTLTTNALVTATEIDVTVITFNAVGAQNATAVISFSGPFAPGQTFTAYSTTDVYDNNASCAVADVASNPVITYSNDSPVPGAS
jgi:predicted small lipoprotein YifL